MTKRSSQRRTTSNSKTTNSQRAVVGGLSGAVILIIVLIAQYVLGINVLDTSNATSVPADNMGGGSTTGDTSGAVTTIPGGIDGGWFQLYFTEPINSENEADFHGSPVENALVAALDGAQTSIDVAAYEMNSQPITDALIHAKTRGVTVRMVTDGEFGLEKPTTTVDQLEAAGIKVVSDGSRGAFMHDKFFVIDGLYVWTGSTNMTVNGFYNNNNNSILIRSSRLAQNYTTEFEELFAGKFGKTSPTTVPNPTVTVEGTRIETYFESEGDVPTRLAELVKQARSVRFMAFSFTESLDYNEGGADASLMDLLRDRAESGQLDLMGIVETSSRQYIKPLVCGGVTVEQDGNPDVFHHKVIIFDDAIVAMGSFNFSNSAANDNDENVLIIFNKDIARAYLDEFDRRWAQGKIIEKTNFGC